MSETNLRQCPVCKYAVNMFEWRQCKNIHCLLDYNHLIEIPSPRSDADQVRTLTVEERRKFVMNDGMHCPVCALNEIMPLGEFDLVEDNKVTRLMMCPNHHRWHEVYTLTAVMTPAEHDASYCPPLEKDEAGTEQPVIPTNPT